MNLTFAKAVDRYVGIAACWVLAAGRLCREVVSSRDELVEPRTILLVKFWGLGNIVLLLPVVRLLRERFPGARFVFVSLSRNRDLLDACEEIDERVYVNDGNVFALVGTLMRALWRARRARPDLAIDFEQFARASVVLACLAGSRQIIGLATPSQGRRVLYHKQVRYDDTQHMGQTYLDLARAAGVQERVYRPAPPVIDEAARRSAEELLAPFSDDGPLIVLHPGSGDNFQGRRWPIAHFVSLADRLVAEAGARIVVTGVDDEADLTARLVGGMQSPERAVDAAGRLSVLALAALLDRATLLVTNDTAPVHLGSALGLPVFAFFGPNTPRLYGPLSRGSHAFYRALPCSPCLTNMNYKTSLCRMPVCIRDISVPEVAERVLEAARDRTSGVAAGLPA